MPRALSESATQRAIAVGQSNSRELRAIPLSPGPVKRKVGSSVRRAKPLEPDATDDTTTNFDRATLAGPNIKTESGSHPSVSGEKKTASGEMKARGTGKRSLPVAKALEEGPHNPSSGFPGIQINTIKPDESGSRRLEAARSAATAGPPAEEKLLLARKRRTTLLFYAVVAAGILALAGVGAVMVLHT
jgi:hypothetical protein